MNQIRRGQEVTPVVPVIIPSFLSKFGLSPREQQLVVLLCEEGLTNKEISRRLGLAPDTIKVLFSRQVYPKLHVPVQSHSGKGTVSTHVVIWYWRAKCEWLLSQSKLVT